MWAKEGEKEKREKREKLCEKKEKKRETGVTPEPLIYTLIYIDLVSLWG